MTEARDIHAYLAELEDIPGTRVFTAHRARRGYQINQLAMSLMKEANRTRFRADEAAYLDAWPISEAAKQAFLERDYNRLIDLGGNIYFLAKLMSTDGRSVAEGVSSMTDLSFADYQQMMLNGGRSPEGLRSIKGQY
ncbi:protocatechuate 4,5-dioxygenase subunit alpha [Sphingomonas metalli]|nr:protocatechuate 4,5-dioxygenase subunit alpha [Sphingomonas metalli]